MEKRSSFDPTTPSSVDGPPQAAPQGVQSSQMYAQPVVITIYIPDTTSEFQRNTDPEAPKPNQDTHFSNFQEKAVRHGFIRKVYAILCVQILVTILIVMPFLYVEPLREYSKYNKWLYITPLVLTIVLICMLACCSNLRRKFPCNLILLAIFTVLEGILVGAICSRYNADDVLIALGITAAVAFSLTLFAFQTKWDFTMMGGILFVCLIIFILFGILLYFFKIQYMRLIYSCIGALLFSAYLVFDTQIMMGGKHEYAISPEEYIFAALNLYVDIINLFLYILQITDSS